MVIFNTLLHTARSPLKGRVLHPSVASCIPYISAYRCNKFHTQSQLCNEEEAAAPAPPKASAPPKKQFNLSFPDYLKAKSALRNKQRIAGVPFALTGIAGSSIGLTILYPEMFNQTPENIELIFGLDPLIFSGISGAVAAGVGYMIGINVFKFLWTVLNKKAWADLNSRDVDFLQRLDRYRFDGDSKFEDDYYGESIKTLSDYRQWVRTQQKKRETHAKFELKALKEKLE